jgi:tetratricopeptide (TPR) repeat protein
MAKVSLRIYNREIERLIEQGHMDEAIAHCRHILKTFPKHLETYRLLGKAYLEARRYDEAADILSRVLMAAPDDFVAHVGLSIIRDEEGKLDDAIWHMERAFDVQPSNAAIQSELQRLYGRRDGVEPPKIRMTRGALAHTYVKGEYYSQAITEIRGVLTEDSQRADMQVLLALSYFRSGQRSDASDICNQLIERYPYCFDANRIMVDLLPANADLPESTQVYRMRAGELDPYANFVKGSIFQTAEVPDAAVNLDRLDYTGGEEPERAWDSSLAIGPAEEQPEWLKSGGFEAEAPPPAPQSEEGLPDFLRAAGWSKSSASEGPLAAEFEEPASDLAPADLPDWLKGQEPPSPAVESATTPIPDLSQPVESPDWLRDLGGMQTVETPEPGAELPGDVPDWVKGLGQPKPSFEEAAPPAGLPDWMGAAQSESETPAPSVESLGASAQEQEDGIAWLESLAAKHGAKPEELVTDPGKRSEAPPEWVQRAQDIGESAAEPAAPGESASPEWVENAQNVGEQFFADFEKTSESDQTGMWLRDLREKTAPQESAPEESLERGEIPEWLSDASQPADAAPSPGAGQDLTEWLSGLDSEPGLDFDAEFLRAAARPPFPSRPEAPAEKPPVEPGLPDWISEAEDSRQPDFASAPTEEPDSAAPESPVTLRTDLPEWLQGMDEKTGEAPSVPEGDVPPWLHREQWESEAETSTQQPTPTSPADWHPLEGGTGVTPPASQAVPGSRQTPKPGAATAKKTAALARRTKGEGQGDANILSQAKAELDRGDIPAALEHFGRLVRKGKYLEEIIAGLTDSLYRYPVEVGVWQTLGDAYMRANRLKEALDAYNKAEELIR